ncbi:putative MFS drug efflux transporter [Aspergillus undulatus]|uniref:putative MFS drug efflux transporter n=1 Tax=Aspergillus undulatus TaxID=1810928 RepID=UPI003CCD9EF0
MPRAYCSWTIGTSTGNQISGWKLFAVVFSVLSSTFLFALDNTVTANIQAEIVRYIGLVMSASATVLWGKVFFHFNTKWTYIISVVIFEVGSALCGAAPNMDTLIVGCVLYGVGGSGLYLGDLVWFWAFYINLLVGAACAPVYLFLILNIDPPKGTPFIDRAREIEYVGATLNTGAFVSGDMAISFGGATWAWNSPRIIALFVVSAILFTLLTIQQAMCLFITATRRIFPVEFLNSRTLLILFATTAAARTAAFVPIYIISLFFQFTRGDDALGSGVRLLPFIVLFIFAIIANGAFMSEFRILTGLGLGVYLQAAFSVAQASVPRERITNASCFTTCSQVVGSTITLAIANSVCLNKAQGEVARILPGISLGEVQSVISGTCEILSGLPAITRRGVEAALTLLLSLLMKRGRLFKQ